MADPITTITIPSNRIYLDTLGADALDALMLTRYAYSRAKEWLYNRKYEEKILGQEQENNTEGIKRWMREKLCIVPQDYYVTSLQSHAYGMVKSQVELQKVRKEEYTARCEARKKKLKTLRQKLTYCEKAKASLIRSSRSIKAGHGPLSLYIPRSFRKHLAKKDEFNSKAVYEYELWIDSETKRLKAAIAQIEEKGRRDEKDQAKPSPRATFGGKAFYRSKDTTDIDMVEWHELRDRKRNHMILFSGRYDAAYKNWLVRYDYDAGEMEITMMDGRVIALTDVRFPYRGEELRKVLKHKKESGWSVGYWMDFRVDHNGREYFLIKASFNTRCDGRVNDYIGDGVISIDMNLDNISWSELDGEGHLLHSGMIRFNLYGKSSGQIDDILGRACSIVISICVDRKKPLAMEKIDLVKKSASLAYGKKNANRGTRLFAYKKMSVFLKGKALRAGVGVIEVDPAYTSFFGKVKYMKQMRCAVHMAASYVIGRRGMGFRELVPKYLKKLLTAKKIRRHHWSQAAYIDKKIKGVPAFVFRINHPVLNNVSELDKYYKKQKQ